MTVYKYNWNNICWQYVESQVFQWQREIYNASFRGNKNRIYYLQSKLIRSTIRKFIVIRRNINNFEKQSIGNQYINYFFYDNSFGIFIKNMIYKKTKFFIIEKFCKERFNVPIFLRS